MKASLPSNETERLAALHGYAILDSLPEREYQDIVNLAAMICETPVAVVSLVDSERQWFKARIGLEETQTGRDIAFCAHALEQPDELLIVPDASLDQRFMDNPLVTGKMHIGFYAGAPLCTRSGMVLGTLCVIDHVPRTLSERQKEALASLSRQVMSQLELRASLAETQKAQAQLLHADKMASIGQLAAGVAHEINNPVAYVRSNMNTLAKYSTRLLDMAERCSALLERTDLSATVRDRLQEAVEATDLDYLRTDLTQLVRGSLDGLARVTEIVAALQAYGPVGVAAPQPFDLHAGIDTVLRIAEVTIRDKAQIVREYGDLAPLRCIGSQICQVVMNLVINAAQAIDSDGIITIATSSDAESVRISISDTGNGIAAEHLRFIFDPFFTTKPVGSGTGLGLSISYNIVQKHGGSIEVASTPGRGTTFVVVLPRRMPAAPPLQAGTSRRADAETLQMML